MYQISISFECNTDVTRFVFTGCISRLPIFPVLAENGAGGGAGAPHGWLNVTYPVLHPPAPILQAVQVAAITVPVHGAAPVLLLSEAVVTLA